MCLNLLDILDPPLNMWKDIEFEFGLIQVLLEDYELGCGGEVPVLSGEMVDTGHGKPVQ